MNAVLADVKPMEPERDLARLLCPACSNILKLPLTAGGRTGKCPRCQNVMNVAADLGALWLEREVHGTAAGGGAYSRPISTLTPVSGTTPTPPGNGSGRRFRIDPLVLRVGVGAAVITLLVVWQLLTSHFEEESRKRQVSIEQGEEAVIDLKRLAATNTILESDRQKILAENQRLKTELARANATIARAAEEKAELERKLSLRGESSSDGPRIP